MRRMIVAEAMALLIAAIVFPGWGVAMAQAASPGQSIRFEPPPGGLVPQPGRGSIYREHHPEDRGPIARPNRAVSPGPLHPSRVPTRATRGTEHKSHRATE